MKKSLIYIPGFNLTLILCNSIFVNRFNREKAQEALKKAVETMSEKNLKIWVFPEGMFIFILHIFNVLIL